MLQTAAGQREELGSGFPGQWFNLFLGTSPLVLAGQTADDRGTAQHQTDTDRRHSVRLLAVT